MRVGGTSITNLGDYLKWLPEFATRALLRWDAAVSAFGGIVLLAVSLVRPEAIDRRYLPLYALLAVVEATYGGVPRRTHDARGKR